MMDSNGAIPVLHIKGETRLSALDQGELGGFRIEEVTDIERAFAKLRELSFAAVLLDLMLRQGCGFEALLQLRRYFAVPILTLSSRNHERDRILAYEMGADDFWGEGIGYRELVARLRVGIGRSTKPLLGRTEEEAILMCQDLQVDVPARVARQRGEVLDLTRLEFDLLVALMRRAGCVCSREALLRQISENEYTVLERTVDVHIASLRKKLSDPSNHPRFIQTVRGVGYSFLRRSSVI